MGDFKIDPDYNDVPSRIRQFREKHPEGSLQPADPSKPYAIETVGDETFIVYCAAAYRTADDVRPGIGTAWELVPGKTPYTRGSEIQNAETSAWGRAIVAALAADTKRIASDEEIHSARSSQELPPLATEREVADVLAVLEATNGYPDAWKAAQLPTISGLRGVLAGEFYVTKAQHAEMLRALENAEAVSARRESEPSSAALSEPVTALDGPASVAPAGSETSQEPAPPLAPVAGSPSSTTPPVKAGEPAPSWKPPAIELHNAKALAASLQARGIGIRALRLERGIPPLNAEIPEPEFRLMQKLLEDLDVANPVAS